MGQDIFVFGSNLAGVHGAGAAKAAVDQYGAIWGQGYGLQGNSFAIPTKDENIETLPLDEVRKYVNKFLEFAEQNEDMTFLVTQIGCGLAGFTVEQIAPFFRTTPLNIKLPRAFMDFIYGAGEYDPAYVSYEI
jgi:hypothetical protein